VFSIPTTGAITISAWIRPATLAFPTTEGKGVDLTKSYVHWLGKGEGGRQEWAFRMYSADNTVGRGNRISFYVFNPEGKLGDGSYFQDTIEAGVWIHVVGAVDEEQTYIYRDGVLRDTDNYRRDITPEHGSAPLRIGTRDLNSFFEGEIREVRIWDRTLAQEEVKALHDHRLVPSGLVAEYLLNTDIALDTTGTRNGRIVGGMWVTGAFRKTVARGK
jgi:concanavalin A-like lectin/glucanase superfamily protein